MGVVSFVAKYVDVVTAGGKVYFVTYEWNVERRLNSNVHSVH
jgi:hypothetical protein